MVKTTLLALHGQARHGPWAMGHGRDRILHYKKNKMKIGITFKVFTLYYPLKYLQSWEGHILKVREEVVKCRSDCAIYCKKK